MANLAQLEANFQRYTANLERFAPDGIIEINLDLLRQMDLLDVFNKQDEAEEQKLPRSFQVLEAPEKITLFNDDFAIWIVPSNVEGLAVTYILIGTHKEDEPIKLDVVLSASGVYNNSKMVLRVIDALLKEIQENEEELHNIKTT
jgi:hypothetical protein